MSTSQDSQWKTTYQGATAHGRLPEGQEKALWVFATFLRESVMAYPQGTVEEEYREFMIELDRKSTRLNSSHSGESRMPSSA